MNRFRRFAVLLATAMLLTLSIGPGTALAADENHGIGLSKGCIGTTRLGDPYRCSYAVTNNTGIDEAGDTLTITSLVDTINRPGTPNSGNILQIPGIGAIITFDALAGNVTPASCANLGTPTAICTLPSQSRIRVGGIGGVPGFSFYTTTTTSPIPPASDYDVDPINHVLTDTVALTWQDTCSSGTNNCPQGNQSATTGSSTTLIKRLSTTATDIHNAAHQVVLTVPVGTTVHDFVTVTGAANQPTPSGNVTIDWFLNGTCAGTRDSNSGPVGPLVQGATNSTFDATGFSKTVTTAGFYSFQAHYLGDAMYNPSDGACEPLRVVDANIQITPNGVNRVGATHTFTGHVNVNDGTGFVNAPAGTTITFSNVNTLGANAATTPPSCVTVLATGSCTTTITSTTTGVSTVSAHTTVSVAGVSLTRHTDGTGANSGPAVKTWVNARISITPDAFNAVGQPHTFVATLTKDQGDGAGFVVAPGEAISITLIPSLGATPAPAGPFNGTTNAAGQFSATFTSPTAGKVVGHAAATLSVAGSAAFSVETDGLAGNSGDANKVFQDANIQITPDGVNHVGDTHTFTGHVNVAFGNSGPPPLFVNAPAGTSISFTIDSGPGAFTSPNPCVTVGATGSCTITMTSAVTGVTKVSAHTTFTTPDGVTLTRHTDGVGANSGPATKTWVNARISITPSATNEVNQPHTFTVRLEKDPGTGVFVAAAGEHVDFSLTNANGAVAVLNAAASTCDNVGANTDAAGQCIIVFTSATAGTVTGHAMSTLSVAGSAPFTVQTNGANGNSGDAVKTFVDANIQITPDGTNRVGATHTFTAHVNVNAGDGLGFVNAPAGTLITFTNVNTNGANAAAVPPSCLTVLATGSCTTTITSTTTGVSTVSAHTTVSVGGLALTRHTDGVGANSGPAVKRWVNARIAITPDATNEVGQPHTFTVTLQRDNGDGLGFVPFAGAHVNFSLTNSNGAAFALNGAASTCDDAGANTNAAGQCLIVFTSPTAGQVTGHASWTGTLGTPTSFTVETDGANGNSGDAVKTFVDANIQITPNGVNRVGATHTFTAHVNVNAGLGAGFVPAPAGTVITFTNVNTLGANAAAVPPQCVTVGTTGSCTTTITSTTTGVSTVSAHTTVSVGGLALTRHTNGTGANSGPAVKTWVNAKIAITPDAFNEVGQPHTFTVTLLKDVGDGAGFVAAAGEHVDATLIDTLGASHSAPTGTCLTAGANTNAAGQCTITFTSLTPGVVKGHATSTLSVAGSAPFTVSTDATGGNSGDATKVFQDANIQITPNGVNRVGDTHTFTGHVNVNLGNGTFVNAPAGTPIDFTIDSGPGAFTSPTPCLTVGTTGSCTITLVSAVTGVTTVSAHVSFTTSPGGVVLTRHTNGVGANSGPATKTWVNARISITPDATNEVGQPHTFTATLQKDPGTGVFVAAAGEALSITFTPSLGATPVPAGPFNCTTDINGQCFVTFTSATTGKVTAHAAATLSVAGSAAFTVETNGTAGNSGDAVKTFVDANIQITPETATNPITTNHVLTGHVNVNAGQGAGYVNAPAGTLITYSLTNAGGATASFVGPNSCLTVLATGSCTVIINSSTTGTTTIKATTTVNVGGVLITRTTGDGKLGDSVDANKIWASARIRITPDATNEVGQPHTFTVLLEKDAGAGFVPAAGEHVTVTLTNSNGAAFTAPTGTCTAAGPNTNAAGQCVITFTSPTAGQVTGHASSTLSINGAIITVQTDGANGNSGDAVKTFVDANIQITPNGVNRVGATHTFTAHVNVNAGLGAGFVPAPAGTVITFTNVNTLGANAAAVPPQCVTVGTTGSCTTTITSTTTGVSTVSAHTTVSVGGLALTRHTNGTGANSGPAVKTWVNAKIAITPDAFNEVGQPHTFTVTLLKDVGDGAGFVAAAGEHVDATLIDTLGASHSAPTGTCLTAGANTNAAGQCTITFTSLTPGVVKGHATSTLSVAGSAPFTVSTDATGGNSGDATKVFQDANIQITPNGVNRVGDTHTFTGHVNVNLGNGTFVNAPAGTPIDFTIDSGPGAFTSPTPCLTVGTTGSCTITLVSAVTGVTTVSAHVSFTTSPGGIVLTRHTNGVGANSGPATKTWVNAKISITPDATNEVGQPHTFTVTLMKDLGNGAGFVAAAGETVTVTLTASNGASISNVTSDCSGGTNAAGQCTVTFTSPTPGQITGNASWTGTLGTSTPFTVSTNGVAPNSGPAVKTFVDANIQITPQTAINPVSTNHTITGHVNINAGGGAGYVNAPAGTLITFTLTNSGGAAASFVGPDTCLTVGATGTCTVVISSSLSGTTTIKATTTVTVGGVPLTRATGDGKLGDSADATKLWADDAVRTDVHDAAHTVILTANGGDVVHDKVFVTRTANTPAAVPDPTGNVVFHRYANAACTGASVDETVALAGGVAESATFTVTGDICYKAEYLGDANYPARTGADEPLTVNVKLPCPAGSFTYTVAANGDLLIKYDQFPAPNDNSYGVNAVGWGTKGHTFGNLTGSDKAGFQLVDPGGSVVLDFTIDSISAKTGTPSGYGSLGPFGGDGDVNVGTLTPADIVYDTAISRNLNNTGYFVGGVQVVGNAVANLLVNSPPTLNTVDSYVLTPAAAAVFTAPNPDSSESPGWNFHNTFFVTIKAAKLAALGFNAATWKVQPNEDELHNSPAKPCPCPTDAADPSPTITVVPGAAPNTTKITLAQSLAVNDNSYGTGADASWAGKGHTFSNLLGSDKLQVVITQAGVKKYDFTLDYISAKTGTPSGYGSLGPTGGDGSTSVSQGAGSISAWSTSLDTNMNVTCPPPAGPWTTNSPTSPGAAECPGWNFVNSYTVTVAGTFTASEVTFPSIHNSPAKPATCPTGGGATSCNLTVTKTENHDKEVRITIKNNGNADAVLAAINNLTWPAANGKLMEIKLDGESLYKPAGGVTSVPATLGVPPLKADPNKREIKKGSSDVLKFVFQNNGSTLNAGATVSFEGCPTALPIS